MVFFFRIEDILAKYVDQKYKHLNDVGNQKLRQIINHIQLHGEENKFHYLSKQIHHLELQIKKAQVDIQLLDANLWDYELDPQQPCHSLSQLSWCEKNLNQALHRVLHRKNFLIGNGSSLYNDSPFLAQQDVLNKVASPNLASVSPLTTSVGEELNRANQNLSYSQLIMKLDPWISPYSSKVRDTIIEDVLNGASTDGNGTTLGQFGESSFPSCTPSRLITQSWPSDVLDTPFMGKNMQEFPGIITTAHHSPDVLVAPSIHRPSIPIPMIGQNSNNYVNVGDYADGSNTSKFPTEAPADPTLESAKHPPPIHGILQYNEPGGFCSTTNQDVGSQEWDGFLLAENLNIDDFDIIV
ncbi:hypothetical protein LINPERPRIM_LOCUS31658 [Linum perenne]